MDVFDSANSTNEIRLQPYTLTVEDILSISWRKAIRPRVLFLGLASLLIGSLFVGFLRSDPGMPFQSGWMITPIFFVLSWFAVRYVTFPRHLETQLKNSKIGERQVALNLKAITWSIASGIESTVPWTAITSVESDAVRFVITIPGGQFFVIPRRALDQDSEHYLVDRLRETQKLP